MAGPAAGATSAPSRPVWPGLLLATLGAIAFSTGTKQDWRMIRDQHSPVQRGGFSSNELRAQVGQIADIFVLPNQECVKLGLSAPPLRIGNALLPQRAHVNSRLVCHLKLSARKTIHPNLRPIEGDDTARKITPQTSTTIQTLDRPPAISPIILTCGESKSARLRFVSNFFWTATQALELREPKYGE